MKLSIALPAVAAVALLTLAGCSIPAEKAAAPSDSPAATSQAATTAPSAAPKPAAKSALIVKFGETVEYADGITVTVKHTGTAIATHTAAPETARGAEVQLFELTLTNGTAETFDPSMFSYSGVFGKTGIKAEKVFDSGGGISADRFDGVMIPAGTQTIITALLIPTADVKSTVFTLQPTYKHKAAVVTGGL